MINISEEYKRNINNMFGEIGSKWIDLIPTIIEKYSSKFRLTNIKVIEPLTYNIVMFADSKDYGPVVFKIEIPYKEMTIREAEALELNNGKGACKCYYKNIDDGVLLIERLYPGKSLNEVNSLDERTRVFSEVLDKFSIEINHKTELPSYKDILQRSIDMVYTNDKFNEIKEVVSIAERIYQDIECKNESNHLLHSDLYSDNIILSNNEWKSIDPHGFIGNKILDTAIFIQKELDKIGYTEENIRKMIKLVSYYCRFTEEDIANAFYVNYVLNICWDKEVNLDITTSLERSEKIHNYITNINKIKQKNKK